jgi:ketosteroid isomerase-like protein
MSRENVELVRSLFPPPDTDFVVLFRDDAAWEMARRERGRFFDEDVESAIVMPGEGSGETKTHRGIDGLRQTWLDWLQPWASYHFRVERMVDLGEQVLVVARDRGRRRDMDAEVESPLAAVWTVRQGHVVKAEFYATRDAALQAVGLRE